jgi:putative transposase
MPRIARALADGGVYHVLNRGNARRAVFFEAGDYRRFEALIQKARERHPLQLLAYCLMPNHFHLLVRPLRGVDLSRFMQWLLTSHVRRHHQRYGTSGHLWQGRFKSFLIQEDAHLFTVMRYIERNPVRARLVGAPDDWPWSSHRESIGAVKRTLTDPPPLPLPSDWASFVASPLTDPELEEVRRSVRRQAPYGTSDWQAAVCAEYGLQSTLRRGRPKTRK